MLSDAQLGLVVKAVDQASSVLTSVGGRVDSLGRVADQARARIESLNRTAAGTGAAMNGSTAAVQRAAESAQNASAKFDLLGLTIANALGTVAGHAIMSFVGTVKDAASNAIIGFNSTIEQSAISFRVMTGSAVIAQDTLEKLKNFAAETPFTFPDILVASRQLLAYGTSANELVPTLNALGNIAAAVGKERLPLITLAFGQVQAAGKLTGAELRQFSESGLPLLQMLADKFKVSTGAMQDMISDGKIGFKEVKDVIMAASVEGGKFFNLMKEQSTTFTGALSNISDRLGFLIGGGFKPLYDVLRDVANEFAKFLGSDTVKSWSETTAAGLQRVINFLRNLKDDLLPKMGSAFEPILTAGKDLAEKVFTNLPMLARDVGRAMDTMGGAVRGATTWVRDHQEAQLALAAALTVVGGQLTAPYLIAGLGLISAAVSGMGVAVASVINFLKGLQLAFLAFGPSALTAMAGAHAATIGLGLALGGVGLIIAATVTNWGGFRDTAVRALAIAGNAAQQLASILSLTVLAAIHAVATAWANLMRGIASAASFIPGIGQQAFQELGRMAEGADNAAAAVHGLQEGIVNASANATKDLVNLANAATQTTENTDALKDAMAALGNEKSMAERMREARLAANAAAAALGGGGGSGGGVAGAAEKAKTALQELSLSVSELRKAMELLQFPEEEIRRVLLKLGANAYEADKTIYGLSVTVRQLAEALNRAGLDGAALAKRVEAIQEAKRAEEEAAKTLDKLREAQQKARQEAEKHREELLKLADDITSRIAPAFSLLFESIGAASSAQVTALNANLTSLVQVGAGIAGRAASIILPAVVAKPGEGQAASTLAALGGSPVAGGGATAMQGVTATTNAANVALDAQAEQLSGKFTVAWTAASGILADAHRNLMGVAQQFDTGYRSAELATKGILGGADAFVAMSKAGGDTSAQMGQMRNNADALAAKLSLLEGADRAAAGAAMDSYNALILQMKAAEGDERAMAVLRQAMDALEPVMGGLAKKADEAGKAFSAGFFDRLVQGKDALAAAQLTMQDIAKQKWIADLRKQVEADAEAITVALKNGLDPSEAVAKAEKTFAAYKEATAKTLEELNAEAVKRMKEDAVAAAQEIVASAAETFKKKLELGLVPGFDQKFDQENWERSMYGGKSRKEWAEDAAATVRETQQAISNELRKQRLKEHYQGIAREQLGKLLAQFTTTGDLRLPLGEVLRMGEFAGFTPAKLRDLLGKAGIPDFFLPMAFRQRALSEDFVGVFHHGGTAAREGFAYVQKGEVMTPAPDMKDVVTVLTAILGAIQTNRPVIDRQALSEAVSYDIGQQARLQSLLGAI